MLRINFLLNNELTLMYSSTVLRIFLDQTSNIDHSSDGNGIMFAPMCKADVDSKCFTSCNKKICEHKVNAVKLDMVGDFVVFPSRIFHRGYYTVASNMTYYRAQLFCNVIIPYYIEFNGPVMASMKIKTVQTILLSAL